MKKTLLLYILMLVFSQVNSQTYDASNSLGRIALVQYTKDERGFFKKQENVSLQEVSGVITNYGYNNKSHELYLLTEYANCVVTVNNDLAKILKKSKSIPQLKDKEVAEKNLFYNKELDRKIEVLNANRLKQIEDSIAQAKADSIEAVRQKEAKFKQQEAYRSSHSWKWLPIGGEEIKCSLCETKVKGEDSIFVLAMKNDTIYYIETKKGFLNKYYPKLHAASVPYKLKQNESYMNHTEVFADSLSFASQKMDPDFVDYFNHNCLADHVAEVMKEAPYGFVESWDWDKEYSMVTMELSYTNLNKKTIKYIDVNFKITNKVGDVRKTGVFKGTGPVEMLETSSWDWDSSYFFVEGDASRMYITQITLTYMDGTKKVLPRGQIKFQ